MPVRELAHTWYMQAHTARERSKYVTRAARDRISLAICRDPVAEVAQERATGWRSGVYLGFIQAREPERHRSTLLDTDRHRPALPVTQPTAASRTTGTVHTRSRLVRVYHSSHQATSAGTPPSPLQSDQSLDIDSLCQVQSQPAGKQTRMRTLPRMASPATLCSSTSIHQCFPAPFRRWVRS